jgi:hypothetical protein
MTEKILKATHSGELNLNGFILSCSVLENETRVFSERSLANAFGIKGSGAYWKKKKLTNDKSAYLPEYLSANYLNDFISNELREKFKSAFTYIVKNTAKGVEATVLPDICDVFIQAQKAGIKNKNIENVANTAYKMIRGFAHVGIIALVDEATGYQDVRVKHALEKILAQYLLPEAKQYKITYPLELYRQWYRLNNWDWTDENKQKRPSCIGTWTNEYIYKRLAGDEKLLKELKIKNPKIIPQNSKNENDKGYRKHKYFQFLTDEVGEPRLREFFGGLIALAKASTSWRKYISMVNIAYPTDAMKKQLNLPFKFEDDKE